MWRTFGELQWVSVKIQLRRLDAAPFATTVHQSYHLTHDINLDFHLYKIQLTYELKPADHQKRSVFVNFILETDRLPTNVILLNEMHIHLHEIIIRKSSNAKKNCNTVNDERNGDLSTEFLWPQVKHINTEYLWFQQDWETKKFLAPHNFVQCRR